MRQAGASRGSGARQSLADRRASRAEVDDPGVVLNAAARFLEARPRSVAEVRRRLTTAGYRPELVEAAIGRLSELGMLGDAAFARAWVESRDRAHPRGEVALRRELGQKGIDRAVVDEVLEARRDGADEDADLERGRRLLDRHANGLAREPDAWRRRARTYALLARNGFDPETAGRLAAEAASSRTEME